jgi:acetolactate synthase-1/3 small subunit
MNAKVIDISLTSMTLEISDTFFHLSRFEEIIRPYGIIEMVRTGTIAIQKGNDTLTV